MHELSIAGAVVNTATRHAEGRRVTVVRVRVGRMRQVVPDSLRFCFDIVARDGVCEGAQLELVEVDVHLCCRACAWEWLPDIPAFRCPRCSSADVSIEEGDELVVDEIEVEEAECIAPG
jgi:hydrogenase nickel incorporation protein HypA/HybF